MGDRTSRPLAERPGPRTGANARCARHLGAGRLTLDTCSGAGRAAVPGCRRAGHAGVAEHRPSQLDGQLILAMTCGGGLAAHEHQPECGHGSVGPCRAVRLRWPDQILLGGAVAAACASEE